MPDLHDVGSTVDPTDESLPRSRRALLAAGAGGIAAAVVSAFGRPAPTRATNGGSIILGSSAAVPFDGTGTNEATAATAIYSTSVTAFSATSGSGSGTGLIGQAASASGTTYGVRGIASGAGGRGVLGDATATSGATRGVVGQASSTSGRGVFGYASASSGTTYGVYGQASSTAGRGVQGYATASSGATRGVYGQTDSTEGMGIIGFASALTGATAGVHGQVSSVSGSGVVGLATATTGVNYGVRAQAASQVGVAVHATNTFTDGSGNGGVAIRAEVPGGGTAVVAVAPTGTGVFAQTGSDYSENAAVSAHSSNIAPAVKAESLAPDGGQITSAILGRTWSNPNGHGVFGVSLAATQGTGVFGSSVGVGGIGVRAAANDGTALSAAAETGTGALATVGIGGGVGVDDDIAIHALAHAVSGKTRGVVGETNSPDGTAIQGFSAPFGSTLPAPRARTAIYGQANQGVNGVGVRGHSADGIGLFGSSTTGYALRAAGRVTFDKAAGIATVPSGQSSVVVTPELNLTSSSAIVATLMGNAGGATCVKRVAVDTSADTFTILLTAAATADVRVAWIIIG